MSKVENDIIIKKIYEIRPKPGMYIFKNNVGYLYLFLAGYLHRQYEIDSTFRTVFEDFSDFVNHYYGERGASAAGWGHVITMNEFTEEEAFRKFYELFDLFVESLKKPE